jgi:hypothetical protein
LSDGTIITNIRNQEITTIRGFMPGEWIVNVHVYSKRDQNPTTVTVSIDKVNPVFKTLYVKNIVLTDAWQEETVTRFEMLANGDILSWADLPNMVIRLQGGETSVIRTYWCSNRLFGCSFFAVLVHHFVAWIHYCQGFINQLFDILRCCPILVFTGA